MVHEELQIILDALNEGIVTCRPDGDLLYWNPTALRMHGFASLDEVVGALSRFHTIYELSTPEGEVVGHDAWPLVRILRGEPIHGLELRIRRLDQHWSRIFSYSGCLAFAQGAPTLGVLAILDVTERWEREDALLRSKAEQNAELERRVQARTAELCAANQELDSFAYAVSHDLRAPLRAMSGFSQALVEDAGPDLPPEARDHLDEIILAARRMGHLIDGLLTLSRSTRGELEQVTVDLSARALALRRDLERGHPDRVVTWEIAPNLRVEGDPTMLDVVLANLLENAWKYTAKTPGAHIRLCGLDAEDAAGGRLGFRVVDNGAGFDMEHGARLFLPFQRLHRQDEFPGIGVGLATVQRILHRHGGSIRATAAPGLGATFTVVLPAPSQKAT